MPTASPAEVARTYFGAIAARDVEAMVACWRPGGREHIRGQLDGTAPGDIRDFFGTLFSAVPDLSLTVHEITAEDDRVAVRWTATGTFAGTAPVLGIEPNGSPVRLEGIDLLTVRDGLIDSNDAFSDNMAFARQVGLLPGRGSRAETRMAAAFNAGTGLARRLRKGPEQIAEGVWRVQGQPARCNVYFLRDGDRVTMFDAGARVMTRAVATAGLELGGIRRVVLGHGHTDHRGTAPALGVPVLCHADDVVDAEGSGGFRYWGEDLPWLSPLERRLHLFLHRRFWDGGPVAIADTVAEGDEVAGFRVLHLPGHAPGLIALLRESDGVALTSDCFYSIDSLARDCPPHVPIHGYNLDTGQAIESIRKLAALEPRVCWPGHGDAVTGNVREQLERGAAEG